MKKIQVLDTTLRDGEQGPNVAFSKQQKIHMAKALDELGVPIIEVGIPAMGKGEIEAIQTIQDLNLKAQLLTWNRMRIEDIEKSITTGCSQAHITVPASDIHITKKLSMTRNQVIEQMKRVIYFAKSKGLEVSVGAEDASRTSLDFLVHLYTIAKEEGAIRVRFADTVGTLDPFSTYEIIKSIKDNIDIPLDFHGHNDLGLATANAFGAVKAGAEIVSCSMNGLGERAGNTPLEEIVVLLKMNNAYSTNVVFEKIPVISQLVATYSGHSIPKNKPIVGEDVFSHESGIHVDGLLKDVSTYEQLNPELFGRERKIVVGKHSGKKAILYWMKNNGYDENNYEINYVMKQFREGKQHDLENLVN
jgi:homocitrate synthase NifV